MYIVTLAHENPSVGTPYNRHQWIKEFDTLTQAMNYVKDDIATNSDVFKEVHIVKL